mgnify:CR=1 FL=1
MARKVWYKFYVGEIVKDRDGANTLIGGTTELVAQVKSKGLANIIYQQLLEVYPASRFIIECK